MRFNKIPLIVGSAVALFGFMLLSIGMFNLHRYSRLTSEIPATVIYISTMRHGIGGQQGPATYSWRVTLQYNVNANVYERQLTWSSHSPSIPLNKSDVITILHDPGNPQRIGWVGTGRIGGSLYMIIMGFILFICGFFVTVRQYKAWKAK